METDAGVESSESEWNVWKWRLLAKLFFGWQLPLEEEIQGSGAWGACVSQGSFYCFYAVSVVLMRETVAHLSANGKCLDVARIWRYCHSVEKAQRQLGRGRTESWKTDRVRTQMRAHTHTHAPHIRFLRNKNLARGISAGHIAYHNIPNVPGKVLISLLLSAQFPEHTKMEVPWGSGFFYILIFVVLSTT